LPAVYLGARASAIAPDGVIRPALVFVLLASALKLLDVPTALLGVILLVVVLAGLPLWGAVDAAAHPDSMWQQIGSPRDRWIRRQAWLAPVGVGFGFAVVYFAKLRPRLATVAAREEARRYVADAVAAER